MREFNKRTAAALSLNLIALALFLILPGAVCRAQQAGPSRSAANDPKGIPVASRSGPVVDDRYRIGPGDLISINTLDYPQLSTDAVKVDSQGMILLPMIEGEIQAACKTEGELAKEIGTRYLKYLQEPQVKVFVKEYQSQPVAVIGAVHSPGRFQLQRRVRLLELMAFVAGPTQEAGGNIQIIHAGSGPVCGKASSAEEVSGSPLVTLKLRETLLGRDEANPFVQPGDIVTVLEAEQYYVVGNVVKPSAYPLKERVSITQAIAFAGGTLPNTKTERIRIVRQAPGSSTRTELFVDLKAAAKTDAEEVLLQPNDIVEIQPRRGMMMDIKTAFRSMVPIMTTQLPLRVIP